jgi:hypothetical protein
MKRSKRYGWILALLSLLTVLGLALPVSAGAQPKPRGAVPNLIVGTWCYNVHSRGNWHGTICAMVNYNDLRLDSYAEGLITFKVKSGAISRAYAANIYLQRCPQGGPCYNTDTRRNPSIKPNSKSTSLADSFIYVGLPPLQDVITSFSKNPCIHWTNGQLACYKGTIHSGSASG